MLSLLSTGINDTGGKVTTGIADNGGKLLQASLTTAENFNASVTAFNVDRCKFASGIKDTGTLNSYLHEFSTEYEMTLMRYSFISGLEKMTNERT